MAEELFCWNDEELGVSSFGNKYATKEEFNDYWFGDPYVEDGSDNQLFPRSSILGVQQKVLIRLIQRSPEFPTGIQFKIYEESNPSNTSTLTTINRSTSTEVELSVSGICILELHSNASLLTGDVYLRNGIGTQIILPSATTEYFKKSLGNGQTIKVSPALSPEIFLWLI